MLSNKKVYVGKHSKEIQEKAFALGIKWNDGDSEPCEFDAPFLYFKKNKFMTHGNNISVFNSHCYEEITAEEILAMEVSIDKTIPIGTLGWYSTIHGEIAHTDYKKGKAFKLFNTKEEAEAYAILPTLLYWRDKYNEGWKPDWEDKEKIYIIRKYVSPTNFYPLNCLYFKTAEIRDKFTEDFKEELEIVKPLL